MNKIEPGIYESTNWYGTGYAVKRGSGWVTFAERKNIFHVATSDLTYQTRDFRDAVRYAIQFGSAYSRTLKEALADYS